jgi:5'-nucleotidase (lipoprotein e(P4) family)
VHWFRNSAEQRAAYLQAYRLATTRVELLSAGKEAGRWAVVADADETLLDNSTYQKERELAGLAFSAESWTAWVARREARALPGSVAFLDRVRALGGRVAVVTNRTQKECPDTEANLRAERLAFDLLLCKPDGGASEKDSRFKKVQEGTAQEGVPALEIVLFVGDNIQDFPELKQDQRTDLARLSAFGERYIVLPNPMYGSWERNPRQ